MAGATPTLGRPPGADAPLRPARADSPSLARTRKSRQFPILLRRINQDAPFRCEFAAGISGPVRARPGASKLFFPEQAARDLTVSIAAGVLLAILAWRGAPALDAPPYRADELSNLLAKGRVAQSHLANFGVERLDKPLGQSDRGLATSLPVTLQPHRDQSDDRRKNRKSAVDGVRHLAGEEPVRPAGFSNRSSEQSLTALRPTC